MTQTISLFADVQNIYYTCRQEFGRHFNYRALWNEFSQGREVHTAVAYAIDRGDAGQMNFQRILKELGFHVRLKPYIQRRDGSAKAIGMSVLRLIWWMQRLPQTLSYCFQATVILIWLWSALERMARNAGLSASRHSRRVL